MGDEYVRSTIWNRFTVLSMSGRAEFMPKLMEIDGCDGNRRLARLGRYLALAPCLTALCNLFSLET